MNDPMLIDKRPAVTIFSGFLGAGKTTLVNHLLGNLDGTRVAIVVNDVGEINIDASLIREGSQQTQLPPGQVVELSDGCVCCSIQDDLADTVAKLAAEGVYDAMLVECTGVAEPLAVVQSFYKPNAEGKRLAEIVRVDTLVTVVDSKFFLGHWDRIQAGQQPLLETNQRPLFELLVEQVECADVILLNKSDLLSVEELGRLEAMIRTLNQHAEMIRTNHSIVDPKKILLTRRFHPEKTLDGATWIQILEEHAEKQDDHAQETADAHDDAHHDHGHAHDHEHGHGHRTITNTATITLANTITIMPMTTAIRTITITATAKIPPAMIRPTIISLRTRKSTVCDRLFTKRGCLLIPPVLVVFGKSRFPVSCGPRALRGSGIIAIWWALCRWRVMRRLVRLWGRGGPRACIKTKSRCPRCPKVSKRSGKTLMEIAAKRS